MQRATRREWILSGATVGLLAGWWIVSEVWYARHIAPERIATTDDYVARFGQPRLIRRVRSAGEQGREFSGTAPPGWALVLRSADPAWVFDGQGRLIDFCRDPGDRPAHREKWMPAE